MFYLRTRGADKVGGSSTCLYVAMARFAPGLLWTNCYMFNWSAWMFIHCFGIGLFGKSKQMFSIWRLLSVFRKLKLLTSINAWSNFLKTAVQYWLWNRPWKHFCYFFSHSVEKSRFTKVQNSLSTSLTINTHQRDKRGTNREHFLNVNEQLKTSMKGLIIQRYSTFVRFNHTRTSQRSAHNVCVDTHVD